MLALLRASQLGRWLAFRTSPCLLFPHTLSCIMGKYKEDDMVAHRVETTLQQDGQLLLDNLPFHAGEAVEIIILAAQPRDQQTNRYPLRGTVVHYSQPFEPVAHDEWDAA